MISGKLHCTKCRGRVWIEARRAETCRWCNGSVWERNGYGDRCEHCVEGVEQVPTKYTCHTCSIHNAPIDEAFLKEVEAKREELEKRERAELKRLKEKYER